MNDAIFSFADLLLSWSVWTFLYLMLSHASSRLLKERIQAQNEEIERLSAIIDGYRAGAAARVTEQHKPDWPEYIN